MWSSPPLQSPPVGTSTPTSSWTPPAPTPGMHFYSWPSSYNEQAPLTMSLEPLGVGATGFPPSPKYYTAHHHHAAQYGGPVEPTYLPNMGNNSSYHHHQYSSGGPNFSDNPYNSSNTSPPSSVPVENESPIRDSSPSTNTRDSNNSRDTSSQWNQSNTTAFGIGQVLFKQEQS